MMEYAVGFLIISNLGTIWSVLYFGGKSIWFFSALKSQVDQHAVEIKENKNEIKLLKEAVNG